MQPETSHRPLIACLLLALSSLFASATALTQTGDSDGYVLFLDEYLTGQYYFAPLRGLDSANPRRIHPKKLRLPWRFRRSVEIGNADVSPDGRTIVFAARRTDDYDWDIYSGQINLRWGNVSNVTLLTGNAGQRDEDPRFSWDGNTIVYKCDGNICTYPEIMPNPIVVSWCELWAPSFAPSGFAISYTKRCGDQESDRIWQFNLLTRAETVVANQNPGPDRFAMYMDDGRLVYSHKDSVTGDSSLWVNEYMDGYVSLLHDRTRSDDDPYPDKHDRDHIAFIGWNDYDEFYDLYVYRQTSRDSIRLSSGISVVGPVLFRQ